MSDILDNPSYQVVELVVLEHCLRDANQDIPRKSRELEQAKQALADAIIHRCSLEKKIKTLKSMISQEELAFVYNVSDIIETKIECYTKIHEIV